MLKKHIVRETLLYGFSIALMRGISLLMLPLIARHLSTTEFGKMEVLASVAIFGSVIVGMGLESALYRFSGFAQDKDKHQWAANIFTLALIIGSVFAGLTPLISAPIAGALPFELDTYTIELVLYMLALESVIAVPLGWLRMTNQATTFCVLSVGRVIIHTTATLLFLEWERGIAGVFEAGLIAALIQAAALTFFQVKSSGLLISPAMSKKTIIYSIPIVGSGLLAFSLNGLDRFIIATVISIESVAVFSIAAKFSLALTILMQPFGMWWQPKRFTILASENGIKKTEQHSTLGLALLTILFLLSGLFGPILIEALMPEEYHQAKLIFIGLLLVVYIKEAVEFINIVCFKNENTNTQFFIDLISSLSCAALLLLGAITFGLLGIIAALVITQSMRLVLFYYLGQKSLRIIYPIKKIGELFMLSISLIVISYFAFHSDFSASISETSFLFYIKVTTAPILLLLFTVIYINKCFNLLEIDLTCARLFENAYLRTRKSRPQKS